MLSPSSLGAIIAHSLPPGRYRHDRIETNRRHIPPSTHLNGATECDDSAHTAFVNRLAELAAGLTGPVLLVSGDSHDYRVDVGVPWFLLYGATPPANVTQVIVDRSIEGDADWLRLHVDPDTPQVFSWEQAFVP